jgi:serine/threonine protein kinase
MARIREANTEPIPGYRLLQPLGRGGFGEVWKCEAPGGLCKAIKFVRGAACSNGLGAGARQELKALQRIKSIRHPFLLSLDRVEVLGDELVIVMELADKNLQDLQREYESAGLPGIPREELLGYLREAAEALDVLRLQHELQHLDIKPANLFIVSHHVKVADFGLVNHVPHDQSAALPQLEGISPQYAAPERFQGRISPASDQYSLALVYHELLTGRFPFDGKSYQQLLEQHTEGAPRLKPLPEADRPIVARALAKDPAERFPNCLDFVRALTWVSHAGPPDPSTVPAGDPMQAMPTLPATKAALSKVTREQARKDTSVCDLGCTRVFVAEQAPTTNHEGLPDYQFLHCLERNPMGECWEAAAPQGRKRLIKILYGFGSPQAESEQGAIAQLRSLNHPLLVPHEIIEHSPGRVVLATDPVEESLRDMFQDCQSARLPGIPRPELLSYLRDVGRALDELHEEYSLLHLTLNPRTLLVVDGQVRLADFGLAALLWGGQSVGRLNPLYAAPELFDGPPHRSSDQYSLALLYQALLTGVHPHRNQPRRDTPGRHGRFRLDLSPLPPSEREILRRALSEDPAQRFASCSDLIHELARARPEKQEPERPPAPSCPVLVPSSQAELCCATPTTAFFTRMQIVKDLVRAAAGAVEVGHEGHVRFRQFPAGRLLAQFRAWLPTGIAQLKLDGLCNHWNGRMVESTQEQRYVFQVASPRTWWQRLRGREPGLQVELDLFPLRTQEGPLTMIALQLQPVDCDEQQGRRLLQEVGPALLESAHAYLQPKQERRAVERFPIDMPVRILPILKDNALGEAIEGRALDITLGGMRVWLSARPLATDVYVHLSNPDQTANAALMARIVSLRQSERGGYEAGILLNSVPTPAA